jgi:hypothetical protein
MTRLFGRLAPGKISKIRFDSDTIISQRRFKNNEKFKFKPKQCSAKGDCP